MGYKLPKDFAGYSEGTELRDVTLREARSWECNQCGDCCNGLSDGVKKDEATGLPLFVWGEQYPEDLYEERYGQRMLQPIVMGDGGPQVGEAFEIDADGKAYTCFSCSFLEQLHDGTGEGPETRCGLYGKDKDPEDLSTIRPRNCGEFPIFGLHIDDTIIAGNTYVPATGALPRCTWYGIRIVGPWKNTKFWREHWERKQQEKLNGT